MRKQSVFKVYNEQFIGNVGEDNAIELYVGGNMPTKQATELSKSSRLVAKAIKACSKEYKDNRNIQIANIVSHSIFPRTVRAWYKTYETRHMKLKCLWHGGKKQLCIMYEEDF